MKHPSTGMTLIEVLVGISIFAVVVALSSSITASLSTNKISQDRLTINQGAQAYFEKVTDTWRNSASFGKVDSTMDAPADITGYTWALTICEVDMTSASFACKAAQTVTWSSTSKPTLTPTTTAQLMKIALTYTPPSGTGAAFVNGTEIYKR